MRFLPHTETEISSMLKAIGVGSLDELVAYVPAALRAKAKINLDPGKSEAEVVAEISGLAARNRGANEFASFLGAGYYRHYVPAAVRAITGRAEFATSYTPYQAEASQGTTQAIFEFQTLITQLTGLEVANASLYDGASAAAEAVLMAHRISPKRSRIVLSRALWPDYRSAIRTYLSALRDIEVTEVGFDHETGATDMGELSRLADDRLLCVVAGYPNYFGVIEPLGQISQVTHRAGGLLISATAEGIALGLLKAPGGLGADIAVGEGQSFGLPLQFGGPGLGFMAARMVNLRQLPGRLVGQTRDHDGRRAFTLTLSTREQHIRRERATSNICTNHSLCALAAAVFLSLMGRQGLRDLASRNVAMAHAAEQKLAEVGVKRRFTGPFFNEFTLAVDEPGPLLERAERQGLLAGVALGGDYPDLADSLLVAVTEVNTAAEIELLQATLGSRTDA